MKSCPFCAEKIQDAAVKCRFCGEWLDKEEKPEDGEGAPDYSAQLKEEEGEKVESIVSPPAPSLEEVESKRYEEDKGDVANVEIRKEGTLNSWELDSGKKLPIGWGWLLVLAAYSASIKDIWAKLHPQTDIWGGLLVMLPGLGIIIVLVAYFWLRRRLVIKKHYDLKKASGWSGFISWLVISFLIAFSIGLVRGFDNRVAFVKLEASGREYKQEMAKLVAEEETLWERLNLQPATAEEYSDTVHMLEQLLAVIKQKRPKWLSYLSEYRTFLEKSENELLSDVLEIEKMTIEYNDKYQKGIELYIEYYSIGDEAKGEQASGLIGEAMALSEKVESLVAKVMK